MYPNKKTTSKVACLNTAGTYIFAIHLGIFMI
jgi:hypothetical protein